MPIVSPLLSSPLLSVPLLILSSVTMSFMQSIPTFVRWLRDALQVLPSSSSSSSSSSSGSATTGDIVEELNKLERTYSMIMAVLQDAEEREIRDHSVKLWLKHLKELSYDADDLLSEYQYELSRCQVQERDAAAAAAAEAATRISGKRKNAGDDEAFSISIASSFSPGDMLHRIKKIRERFDDVVSDRERFSLRDLGPRRYNHYESPPPTSSFVNESAVLGRDDDKEELIKLLFSDMDRKFSVIPIVGMGGLGKTTLAQLVYNDPRVHSEHFDSRGWVCVSDDFNVIQLTKAIIESLTKGKYEGSDELDNLQHELRDRMQYRKVLLVLDDVWNERRREWDSLRAPFSSAKFLRIIVTTRNDSVAKVMQTGIPNYRPGCLSMDQSWSLFKQWAFEDPASIEETDSFFVDVGRQIANKCNGLPLALKVIGGVLRSETDESAWSDVLESDIWEMDQIQTEILPVLKLSYSRMPSYLKPCFLSCSMFPKDHPLDASVLIPLWIANGYIQGRANKTAEDTGRGYFCELLQRSFFQVGLVSHVYVMHDMIHELARSMTGKECCAIVLRNSWDKCVGISNEVRHLCVDIEYFYKGEDLMQIILPRKEPMRLRTLVYYGRKCNVKSIDIFNKLWGGLRAVILCSEELDELTPSTSVLKHLRYLRLDANNLKNFPETIWCSYNLQELKLSIPSSHLKFSSKIGNLVNLHSLRYSDSYSKHQQHGPKWHQLLPQELTRLVNLRSLYLISTYSECILPRGIGNLTNLHTLSKFKVGIVDQTHGGIAELKTLVNLSGQLHISGLENVICANDAKTANLADKSHLQFLNMQWSSEGSSTASDEGLDFAVLENLRPHTNLTRLNISGYKGCRLPSWLGDPSFASLSSIRFVGCYKLQDFGMLCQLPSLKSLFVKNNSEQVEHIYQPSATGLEQEFPSLSQICFICCPVRLRLPSFQQLVYLTLVSCHGDYLTSITVHHDATFPSRLRELCVRKFAKLELIKGLRFLTSLESLILNECPQLRIPIDDCLPVMPSKHIKICDGDDGDGTKHWCEKHGHHYNPVSPPGSSGFGRE